MRWLPILFIPAVLLIQAQNSDLPARAGRGQALFFEEGKGCGTCHSLAGKGTAVGPDLKRLARLNPHAIVAAIKATRTQYVQQIKLKSGDVFPAMIVTQDDKAVQAFDMNKKPPAEKKIARSDVASITDNEKWKHPPESADYNAEQLADIISYIRYVGAGDKTGVAPSDVE